MDGDTAGRTIRIQDINHKLPLLITARKRSLGQGNVFTPVCHSVHGGGGRRGLCPNMHHRSHDSGGGVCVQEQGSLSRRVSVKENPQDRDLPDGNERAVSILLECILVPFHFWFLL